MRTAVAETSIAVYYGAAMPATKARQNDMVMAYIASVSDATIAETAKATKLDKSSVSGRRNELLACGRLVRGRNRQCSITGKTVQTVKVPEQQKELFQ